jgi:hypothetical protein
MSNPTMSFREFDGYMLEGGLKYSLLVLANLEEATMYLDQAKATGMHKYYESAYVAQLDALDVAEYEKKYGQTIEPVVDYLPTAVEHWIHGVHKKWRKYVMKIRES